MRAHEQKRLEGIFWRNILTVMEYEDIGITRQESEFQVREMVKWGMNYRNFEIETIQAIAVNFGSVFASVVLWWE